MKDEGVRICMDTWGTVGVEQRGLRLRGRVGLGKGTDTRNLVGPNEVVVDEIEKGATEAGGQGRRRKGAGRGT